MLFRLVFAVAFLLSACPWAAVPDAFAAGELTFRQAVAVALEHNHELRALRSSAQAAQAGIGAARGWLLPRLTFEERFLRTTHPGYAFMTKLNQERIEAPDFNPTRLNSPDPINDFQTSLSGEQPLYTRKGFIGLEMSRADARAREEEVLRKEEELVFRLIQAVVSLRTARAFAGAAGQAVTEAEEHVRLAEIRHRNGLGQYADVLRAATARSEAERRKISAEKNVQGARRALGLLLGREGDGDVREEVPLLPRRTLEEYTHSALSRRDLVSAGIREENARKNIKLSEAGYFPYIGVGGAYAWNDHSRPLGGEGNNWQVSAFLRWDLFDGGKREYERIKAKHEAAGAKEQTTALQKAAAFEVYEAYLGVGEAERHVELARQGLTSAEEGKRLVRIRYENGLSPLVDLLSVQAGVEQARANLAARDGAGRLASARLAFVSGTILSDLQIDPRHDRQEGKERP
jgi:outer membrane protein TolC